MCRFRLRAGRVGRPTRLMKAEYVLVICTAVYRKRSEGRESGARGAAWEGQLITQSIYDQGGRNTKFIPIVLTRDDIEHIPSFLAASTHFNVLEQDGYEALYRLLTSQPAVIKPDLGSLRKLERLPDQSKRTSEGPESSEKPFLEVERAVVVWRLPRGFLLLESLQEESDVSWAVLAHHYGYDGTWKHSTHYHESYQWFNKGNAVDTQCRKLHVPRGDWDLAWPALRFLTDVRERYVAVSRDGKITGAGAQSALDPEVSTIHAPGPIRLPTLPPGYAGMAVSGYLRDLAAEAANILKEGVFSNKSGTTDIGLEIARIRREVRVELYRKLDPSHPASWNVEEIMHRYKPNDVTVRESWLREFVEATHEAIACVEEQIG
jgi:hypothetical protein